LAAGGYTKADMFGKLGSAPPQDNRVKKYVTKR
jgi:hypothetical protein